LEIIYFTAIAIGLYLVSDAILDRVERVRGERFKYRNLVFFGIILLLALASFQFLGMFGKTGG
jgi:hypothetical protein